jgi:hypothetical protein
VPSCAALPAAGRFEFLGILSLYRAISQNTSRIDAAGKYLSSLEILNPDSLIEWE